jgi:hypothetical protein
MTTDILAKLTQTNPHAVRAWVVKIISVSTVAGTCTIDPNDGDVVTDVPYWGLPPGVGSIQVALLFDGLLGVVSTGTGTIPVSGVWGQNLNGVAALDIFGPLAETVDKYGAPIYLDSAGLLRSQPLIISGPDTNRLAAERPGALHRPGGLRRVAAEYGVLRVDDQAGQHVWRTALV